MTVLQSADRLAAYNFIELTHSLILRTDIFVCRNFECRAINDNDAYIDLILIFDVSMKLMLQNLPMLLENIARYILYWFIKQMTVSGHYIPL